MRKVKGGKPPFPAQDVVTKTVPAPVEGWDAISPLAAMDPKRAPIMINWVPRPGWIELRAGYTPQNSLPNETPVETLMVYRADTGVEKLFAAQGAGIYDATVPGVVTEVVSGLTSARWQYTEFTIPADPSADVPIIQCVNGVDQMRQFNGTVWSTPSIGSLPNSLTSSAIVNISVQKSRLWYVLKNTTVAAYMPTDAIQGNIAGTQDLGPQWEKGGYLVAMATWTIDGGNGPGDYVAFISSRGQISLFSGTDPTSATTWTLVGTFNVAPPIGYRCVTELGSDVGIITQQGVLPLSQVLPFDPAMDRSAAITARIQNAMALAAQSYSNNFGWQLITFPMQNLLILNVPLAQNSNQQQYVQNLITGAWTQFIGWNANCFEIFNDELIFGDNEGGIQLAYQTGLDLVEPIAAQVQFAYNWFDDPGRTKRVTMLQPLLTSSGNITPLLAVDADFATSSVEAPVTTISGGAEWDVALWDVALWPGGTMSLANWYSASALGHALAIHMYVNVGSQDVGSDVAEFDIGVFDSAQFDSAVASIAPLLRINAFNAIMELGGLL